MYSRSRIYLHKMKLILTIFIGLVLFGSSETFGQNQMSELTVDELYEKARTLAVSDEDYDKARKYAYEALERSPDYHGIRIFLARLYGWEGSYDKAREELQRVFEQEPENRRAFLVAIDIESWSQNIDKARHLVNQAIEYHPEDEELLLKKASLLYTMEEYKSSEKVYKKVLEQSPGNIKARDGLQSAQLKQMKYAVTVSYRYDYFKEAFDPWKFTELGLTRHTPYGPVIGRIKYVQRFGSSGTQFNIEAYPSITDGLYAYISGGYSESSIHPKYRFDLSIHKSLPASIEMEAGIRYLDFVSSQADFYTASLTKYQGRYLFTLRTYYVPSTQNNSKSLSGIIRRYFGNANTYLSFTGGFGSANTQIEFSQDIQTQNSWSLGIEGQYPLSDRFLVRGDVGYESSEFQQFIRERFSFKAFLTYRL